MPWLPKKTVVVPVDFSDNSLPAMEAALELVASPGEIHAIYVMAELSERDPGVIWGTIDDAKRTQNAKESLEKAFSDAKFQGFTPVVRIGDPGNEIVEYAQDAGADLIVIPSRGRTGLDYLLLGSVAERVTRLAKCPVLVLRG
ncbi:MAG: universal stress protein [Pirellulales bacterium]|nr:universal stress protein [Pirellulales bacterium]